MSSQSVASGSSSSQGAGGMLPASRPSTLAFIAAFGAVYLIWGSTYIAIRFAIETLPPLVMAGTRFALAGAVVIAWMRLRYKVAWPTPRQWLNAAIIGGLLLTVGNGLICIAELRMPSGMAALLVATVPLWMTLMEWLVWRGRRPDARVFAGLALGLAGVMVLIDPRDMLGQNVHLWSAAMVLIACVSWSVGSLYSRHAALPKSVMLATGMEMLCGGVMSMIVAGALGQWGEVDLAAVSMRSFGAYAYLVVFGSIIGFSAYIWLLKNVSPGAVSTYAYVNPMVAVLLGWWLANEPIGVGTAIASALIIAAVMLITIRRASHAAPVDASPHSPGSPGVDGALRIGSSPAAPPPAAAPRHVRRETAMCGQSFDGGRHDEDASTT